MDNTTLVFVLIIYVLILIVCTLLTLAIKK